MSAVSGIVLRTPGGWYASSEPLDVITDPVLLLRALDGMTITAT